MINIVGKAMLANNARGCQDEYAKTLREVQSVGESLVVAAVDGKGRASAACVNVNVRGACGWCESVKREKATPV
jgi:hypothetical protein